MIKKIRDYFSLALSISGFVPKHATFLRSVFMLSGLVFSMRLMRLSKSAPVNPYLFFLSTTGAYFGFIYSVLSKKGLRQQFLRKFANEKEAYLAYEAILGFLFFMNGTSMGYICAARKDTLPVRVNNRFLQPLAAILFLTGWTVKFWSAKVVGVDIYYWKDMFYDRKITDFVEEGPYKVLRNPMYGAGQLQTYGTALWYRSLPGLLAAVFYQLAVFTFYLLREKSFIERTYLHNKNTNPDHSHLLTGSLVGSNKQGLQAAEEFHH